MTAITKKVEQKLLGLNGDEAVARAIKQCNVDFVAAFPITPQTIIVERFSEYVANGEVDTAFVCVESEHSALSACVGAAAVGARAFTATASQGLALMHEIVYIASSLRLPIVMAIVNRALSGPINIHCDHHDSMAERDACWIQFYCEDAQEAYDTTIQAFRIAEHPDILLPVMYMMDAFLISHTMQNVWVLPDEVVKEFVGYRKIPEVEIPFYGKVPFAMRPNVPLTLGPLDLFDYYYEHKMQQQAAMERAPDIIKKVHDEYAEISGRRYGDGMIVPYKVEDADIVLMCIGSTAGTARVAADLARQEGVKVGVLRIRSYRPFPAHQVRELLKGVKVVGVLDRCGPYGAIGGPLYVETCATLYHAKERPLLVDFIYGLGGRDMSVQDLRGIIAELVDVMRTESPEPTLRFRGVRE
ncbi:pyruvate ferredoxin oxidoreductase [archaeon]|nr:pyruvate ferredoxin oxidoreductase [archaeon]